MNFYCLTPGTYLITGANAPEWARNRFSFSQPRDTGPEAYCYSSVPACQSPLAVRKKAPQLCRRGPHFRKRVQRYALFPDLPNFSQTFFKKMHFCTNGTQNGEARGGADTYLLLRTRVRERTDGASSRKRRKGRKGRKCCFGLSGLSSKKLRTFCYQRQRRQRGTTFLSRIGELEFFLFRKNTERTKKTERAKVINDYYRILASSCMI